MDAISRRYRKPKGRPSKRRSLCASKIQKRWGKNHIQIDSDSTLCPENSGAMHAENSLIMHIENSISNDGSHSGEKEQIFQCKCQQISDVSFSIYINFFVLVKKFICFDE
ncbi:hypothetical protein TNCT_41651 [Trichonephila clavata]|uniref:Uncharacterized protein n=1 Tax=Trichonephila clavata TaxID=2740835 RepID=A0A8X6LLA5_TRICU|nr:hypothetical protein TNCT_41651 [Trichonephila clavata]